MNENELGSLLYIIVSNWQKRYNILKELKCLLSISISYFSDIYIF